MARRAVALKLRTATDAERILRSLAAPFASGDLELAAEAVALAAEHIHPTEGDLVWLAR